MRIISGTLKGHRFHPPANNWPTRPTTDISKEGLYNILQNRISFEDIVMLDLFGGTGNHCFECISRGCTDATYVDKFRPAVQFVKKQTEAWKLEESLTIVHSDVKRFLKSPINKKFDFIFAGPPYRLPWLDKIPDMVFEADLLSDTGLFILEHNPDHNFENHKHFIEVRNYGQTHFAFFHLGFAR